MIKSIHKNLTPNILLVNKRQYSPPRSETRQECPHPPLLLNTVPSIWDIAIGQNKGGTKFIQLEKKDIKLPLFADDRIIYDHLCINRKPYGTKREVANY